jgi:hypothetical protein
MKNLLCIFAVLAACVSAQAMTVEAGNDGVVWKPSQGLGLLSPVLSGTATGTYTLAGTPTITGAAISQSVVTLSSSGTLTPSSGVKVVTTGSAATYAVATATEGTEMTIISNSDFAHVFTFTGSTLLDGTTGANSTATFAAFKGASITVISTGSTWLTKSIVAVTPAP